VPRKTYDYIIVGGGSAGSVLANRLSADPSTRVLVLEAGHRDYRFDLPVQVPSAVMLMLDNPLYDWRYRTEPEPQMHGRRMLHSRGKILGGSSSINGMIFQRGNALGYDEWARRPGMETWDYAHCLPYFRRTETALFADPRDPYRGHSGPLKVERGSTDSPLSAAFLAAAEQAGYAVSGDVNGYQQEGFGPFDRNVHRGRRLSASRAYLHPVRQRANLEVRTLTRVLRVLFEGRRAVGVETRGPSGRRRIFRAADVILCGGTFNSPQLLQLSGVGNAAELERIGVPVLHDLPGVGENLQDHLEVFIQYGCTQPVTLTPYLKHRNWPRVVGEWLVRKQGPGASNHFEVGGFVRSNDRVDRPNVMVTFLPVAVRSDGAIAPTEHGYQVHIGPQLPESRGTVKVASSDPSRPPQLRFNYLSTERDRREWIESVHIARRILNQRAFDPYNGGELAPGPLVGGDDEILDWVRQDAETSFHVCGTCALGVGPDAVVDPATMRVHGLDGLRVVDASVFPLVPNANLYAPVMMTAEKAADLITGNTPLDPAPLEYFRHELPA
jgi:choline dehydrogenase